MKSIVFTSSLSFSAKLQILTIQVIPLNHYCSDGEFIESFKSDCTESCIVLYRISSVLVNTRKSITSSDQSRVQTTSEDNITILTATTSLTGEAPTPIADIDTSLIGKLSIAFSASANPASVQFAQIITQ